MEQTFDDYRYSDDKFFVALNIARSSYESFQEEHCYNECEGDCNCEGDYAEELVNTIFKEFIQSRKFPSEVENFVKGDY